MHPLSYFLSLATALLMLLLSALPVRAAGDPFPGADLKAGKAYHDRFCVECHTRRFGGEEGSNVYWRENRRATHPEALRQMLTICTSNLNLDLFPEDEHHIAGYLNHRFYRFGLK
ncbi:MAG: hypothetical protein N2557_06575 [Hydrogenophilus sp.]|nr:hypothetical protein [Hydrogenophilus sp.]